MKKYIRTRDRIGERLEPNEECPEVENEHWLGIVNGLIHKDNEPIIAEADTIEELCDEFVGLVKSTSSNFIIMTVIAHSLKELKESLKTELNGEVYEGHYDIIYGAVWCEWGLKYVAKLNEKGELELI